MLLNMSYSISWKKYGVRMIEFNEDEFLKKYKGTTQFIENDTEYYHCFLNLLKDNILLEKIKFANDVLEVPPLKSFILYERLQGNALFNQVLSDRIKKGLGACFGYLFKFIYNNYQAESAWFNDETTRVKTASYFKKSKN
jgi:hypothetical protein